MHIVWPVGMHNPSFSMTCAIRNVLSRDVCPMEIEFSHVEIVRFAGKNKM